MTHHVVTTRGAAVEVDVHSSGDRITLERDGTVTEAQVRHVSGPEWLIVIDGTIHRVHVARDGRSTWVHHAGRTWLLEPSAGAAGSGDSAPGSLVSPMPATILEIHVAAGDAVTAGQVLVVVSAMKMQVEIKAPSDGTVASVPHAVGDTVDAGELLVVVD